MNIAVYLIAGLLSGVLAGMGMGGGILLIPALTLLSGLSQQAAQSVNMLAFIPGAILAILVHKKEGRVELRRSIPLFLGGIFGATGGALLAIWMHPELLKRIFGGFLTLLSVYYFCSGEKKYRGKKFCK